MLNRLLLKYDKFINMLKGIFGNGQRGKDICKTITTLEFFVIIPCPTVVGQGIFYRMDNGQHTVANNSDKSIPTYIRAVVRRRLGHA